MSWNNDEKSIAVGKVVKIQNKIRTAYMKGDLKLVTLLQRNLVVSQEARLLAIRKVMSNKGGKTPGVDGVVWSTEKDVMEAASNLRNDVISSTYKALPVKRVFIPKPGKKELRPLGIPTLYDRAMQAVWLMALSPIAAVRGYSYGVPGLSTHNAIDNVRCKLNEKWCPRWVLEGDISWDNISHEWILQNIPMDVIILEQWLKSGILHLGNFESQEAGVPPTGGIISPMIANMCLDGLEQVVLSATICPHKTMVVRYVDDFIVTGNSVRHLEFLSNVIDKSLDVRGLSLHPEKTLITNISKGFDFLGVHIQEVPNSNFCYGDREGFIMLSPTPKAIKNLRNKVNNLLEDLNLTPYDLLEKFNPIVRGWAEYYKFYNSASIFQQLGEELWRSVWMWVRRKYSLVSARELVNRHYTKVGSSNLLKGEKNGHCLVMYNISKTKILYFNRVQSKGRPKKDQVIHNGW